MSPESPEHDTEYTLTPRTEAKYSKIDEDFQLMMQRNNMAAAGQQRVMSANANYALPVSVPIPGSYGESAMLQASPQMTHSNISPRPSSSETDSGTFCGWCSIGGDWITEPGNFVCEWIECENMLGNLMHNMMDANTNVGTASFTYVHCRWFDKL